MICDFRSYSQAIVTTYSCHTLSHIPKVCISNAVWKLLQFLNYQISSLWYQKWKTSTWNLTTTLKSVKVECEILRKVIAFFLRKPKVSEKLHLEQDWKSSVKDRRNARDFCGCKFFYLYLTLSNPEIIWALFLFFS